jgi:carbonic anhydrase
MSDFMEEPREISGTRDEERGRVRVSNLERAEEPVLSQLENIADSQRRMQVIESKRFKGDTFPAVPSLTALFDNNRRWSERIVAQHPRFFHDLAAQQSPEYLWIGCSDSRVPANEIVGLAPGELFVHRNVANVVVHTDLNCLSVLQYAVDVLRVKHIIVTGHYGCGGIRTVLDGQKLGLIDNWLRHVRDVYTMHQPLVDGAGKAAADRLCELNVIEQALHICETTIVQDVWAHGRPLTVHGWLYSLRDGLLRDTGFHAHSLTAVDDQYRAALDLVRRAGSGIEREPTVASTPR